MKVLMAIVALSVALAASDADAARWQRRHNNRLWSPGIVAHLAYERFMVNHSGPRMVWRGDWVPAYMVR